MKTRVIAYWGTTATLVFAVLSGGLGELAHQWGTLETVQLLGYPMYFLTILGFWKVLGAIALLVPRFPRLREWAYAGIFFNMTGAAASHAFSNDFGPYGFHLIVPACLAVLAVASWALVPQSAPPRVHSRGTAHSMAWAASTMGASRSIDSSVHG